MVAENRMAYFRSSVLRSSSYRIETSAEKRGRQYTAARPWSLKLSDCRKGMLLPGLARI